jgi:alkaline phosphatase
MKKSILTLVSFCVLTVLGAAHPKYVFLFIGDGMSVPQRMMAEEFALKTGYGPLAMNSLPYQAATRTKSANAIITDSAASATAIACGEKTNNGMLGVTPDGRKLESVAYVAKKNGKKVGIISTVTINHATPAGFYAHRKSRGLSYQIALDLVNSGFDYFAGGGVGSKYDDKQDPEYRGNVFELARKAGYTVARTREEWSALKPGSKSWSAFSDDALNFSIDATPAQPAVSELVAKGIEVLDNPGGFFMMCEGGRIDWAGHANDAGANMRDVIALDRAVKVALDFAEKHPDDTLILVTGDHETGGLSMGFAGTGGKFHVERLAYQKCSAERLAAEVSCRIKADAETDFDDIEPLLNEKFGFVFDDDSKSPMALSDREEDELEDAFEYDKKRILKKINDNKAYDEKSKRRFANALKKVFAAHAGVGWSTGSHTALPTLTTAQGVGADILVGMKDNTEIANRLKKLLTK